MEDAIATVAILIPLAVLAVVVRAWLAREVLRVGQNLERRAAVARRMPYRQKHLAYSGLFLVLAGLMPATGWKAEPGTSAGAWHVLLLLGGGFLAVGLAVLASWWVLAGREADEVDANGGVTFEPARPPAPVLNESSATPTAGRPINTRAGTLWAAGVIAALAAIPIVPTWSSPVAAIAGCYFAYKAAVAFGRADPVKKRR